MMNIKRLLSLILVAGLCLSMLAIGTASAGSTSDETLYAALAGEPDSLFPNYQGNKVSGCVDSSIFDTLVFWNDETKTAEAMLATGWEWLDDTNTKIQFTLRDDVYFTNGEKMTASDVLASLKATTEYTRATYAQMFDIENSEVVDDTHVTIALTQPYGNLQDILGCTYYAIYSEKALEEAGDPAVFARTPVGSGPYSLKEWKVGESITLERNEAYWDKDNLPYYKNVVFYFIDDASSRALALQSGDVQIIFQVNNSQIAELEAYGGITVSPYVQNVVQPLTMNEKFEPLADENVRKAILLALDKETLAQVEYLGYSETSKSSLTGAVSSYYYESESFTQDIETAKALIAGSGFSAEDLTFTSYAISGNSTAQTEILQAQLAAIGVTINIEAVDLPTFLSYIWGGEVPIALAENDNWDISRMLKMVDSRVETSHEAYRGDDADALHALIDAAYVASDVERYDAYAAVQQFCTDHSVVTTIANCVFTDAYADSITGLLHDCHSWPVISRMRPVAAE